MGRMVRLMTFGPKFAQTGKCLESVLPQRGDLGCFKSERYTAGTRTILAEKRSKAEPDSCIRLVHSEYPLKPFLSLEFCRMVHAVRRSQASGAFQSLVSSFAMPVCETKTKRNSLEPAST